MRIIDAHAHILDTPNYIENLINAMNENGIERACISGLGKIFNCVDNNYIKKIINTHPNRFYGSYFIRPGMSSPLEIKQAYEDGFKMLKITIPTKPYNHRSFNSLWEIAQELRMPVLFHTGVVTLPKTIPEENVSSWNMHPMRLEPIANKFPDLYVIIAHLGIHWNEDAAELLRMKSNIFADLTGEPDGWRARADKTGMRKWLWWDGAFKKIVFGTDVEYSKIQEILNQDIIRLKNLNIDQDTRELIFYKNILRLLGEK
ncbi:MAG: amidohydrolase family protein [Candidatus Lokiarchaeota archaeon]|nr:amidohydrolase family protein [Candidatus Lokiarchaeota archaeon]MBD3343413.1 amidohydrolase family protein [Candidatus Lokiarchaeota archaeon]